MRYLFILSGPVCLSFMFLPACAPHAEQQAEPVAEEASSTEADVEATYGLFKQIDDTATSGNCAALIPLFTDDIVYMVPNQVTLTSKEALRTRLVSACE